MSLSTTTPTSNNIIALDDDDYRYVLNDGVDYNSAIIPQYFENDVIDLVSDFANESFGTGVACEYTNNYVNAMQNYAMEDCVVAVTPSTTSLMTTAVPAATMLPMQSSNALVLDENIHENFDRIYVRERSDCTFDAIPSACDRLNADIVASEVSLVYPEKSFHQNELDAHTIATEEIIDTNDVILDLTNDEVDQIIDNNLTIPTQCFDPFQLSRAKMMPKISVNEVPLALKSIENEFTSQEQSDDEKQIVSVAVAEVKKRCGRPKGARRTSKYFHVHHS